MNLKEKKPLVSIIIPVYNAAKTLHVSLDSLERQTYENLEIIFVNDHSEDDSLALLNAFKEANVDMLSTSVKIINNIKNRGVAFSRNVGLLASTGDYIFWLDADDWIENDAIYLLVKSSLKHDVDIVGCKCFVDIGFEYINEQYQFSNTEDALKAICRGEMQISLWIFLVTRSLYLDNNIRFLDGIDMAEDLVVTIKLFGSAQKVFYLDQALYHYRQVNPSSMTRIFNEKTRNDITVNLTEIESYLKKNSVFQNLDMHISFLKLHMKNFLLISGNAEYFALWQTWFSEANKFAGANMFQPFRIRTLQKLAKLGWFLPLRLYDKGKKIIFKVHAKREKIVRFLKK